MSISFTGLGAGFDVNTVVDQLMQLESRPLTALQTKATNLGRQVSALDAIRVKLSAVATAAEALSDGTQWSNVRAEVSNPAVASAAATGTIPGALTFNVDQLAGRHALRSVGVANSLTTALTSTTSRMAVSTGLGSIGALSVSAVGATTTGGVDLRVDQLATGASLSGSSALDASTTIGVSNRSFSMRVDGGALTTVTLATGTYTQSGLVAAVNTALSAAGLAATAGLDDQNRLTLASQLSGAAASIQIVSGNALTPLKLSAGSAAGQNGVITVDGVAHNVTDTGPDAVIDIPSGTGTIRVTAGSQGLQTGSATVDLIDITGVGVGDVIDRLNATGHLEATAVRVADSSWRLQITSLTSGSAGQIFVDAAALGDLGTMVTSSEARDATITIGSGAGAFQIKSANNTFTDLMPGVDVTVRAAGETTVTARTVDRTAAVQQLVAATNDALTELRNATRNSPGASGPLAGDAAMRRLTTNLTNAVLSRLDPVVGRAGVSVDRSGNVTFDAAAFRNATETDRDAVTALFSRQLTGSSAVSLASASNRTVSGTWQVVVSQNATKAQSGLLSASGPVTVGQQGSTVTYTPVTGQDITSVAAGLAEQLTQAGIGVDVTIESGSLRLISRTWGSAGGFQSGSDPSALTTHSGIDVVGTIDGQTATGNGQTLSLSAEAGTSARGVRLTVTEAGTHTVTFSAGLAGTLVGFTANSTDSGHPLQGALEIRNRQIEAVEQRVNVIEQRLEAKEAQLRRMYALLDANLGKLNSLSDWISSQVESIPTVGANRRS